MIGIIIIVLLALITAFLVSHLILRGKKKEEWVWVGPGENPFKVEGNPEKEIKKYRSKTEQQEEEDGEIY